MHTDLSEPRSEYRPSVRRRKAEQEDRGDAIERTGFDEDPENVETGFADALQSRVPFERLPESIANHQRCSELRRYREAPCRDQPVVDARGEDGFIPGEIDEGGIAGDWCTKIMRPSKQARIGILDLPAVAIQSTTCGKADTSYVGKGV